MGSHTFVRLFLIPHSPKLLLKALDKGGTIWIFKACAATQTTPWLCRERSPVMAYWIMYVERSSAVSLLFHLCAKVWPDRKLLYVICITSPHSPHGSGTWFELCNCGTASRIVYNKKKQKLLVRYQLTSIICRKERWSTPEWSQALNRNSEGKHFNLPLGLNICWRPGGQSAWQTCQYFPSLHVGPLTRRGSLLDWQWL